MLPESLFSSARIMYRRYSHAMGRKVSPFSLYEEEKVIFVHIPKNAGTFVNSIIYPSMSPEESTKINAHHSVQYLRRLNRKTFDELPKMAILRHPAERLRSAFDYLKFKSPFVPDRAFADKALAAYPDFETFCRTVEDDEFKELLNWLHFQPQVSFICTDRGEIRVDALTSLEHLETGLRCIGEQFGFDWSLVQRPSSKNEPNGSVQDIIDRYYASDLALWDAVDCAPQKCLFFPKHARAA